MKRPRNVTWRVGSKSVNRTLWPSMLLVILLFALLDMVSSSRLLQNPSGFPSSYHLEESVLDAAVKIFDAESHRGVLPVRQSPRPQDERYGKRVLLAGVKCQIQCEGSDCEGDPNPESPNPNCDHTR